MKMNFRDMGPFQKPLNTHVNIGFDLSDPPPPPPGSKYNFEHTTAMADMSFRAWAFNKHCKARPCK